MQVQDFFDFSPGVDVNATIASQALPVGAGSYRYARMEFCLANGAEDLAGVTNVRVAGSYDGATLDHEFAQATCAVNSAAMDPPLELRGGEAVVVTLSYALDGTLTGSPGTVLEGKPDSCAVAGDNTWCFAVPEFVPSATVAEP